MLFCFFLYIFFLLSFCLSSFFASFFLSLGVYILARRLCSSSYPKRGNRTAASIFLFLFLLVLLYYRHFLCLPLVCLTTNNGKHSPVLAKRRGQLYENKERKKENRKISTVSVSKRFYCLLSLLSFPPLSSCCSDYCYTTLPLLYCWVLTI